MAVKKKSARKKSETNAVRTRFECGINSDAKEVYLAGDFNDWDPQSHKMSKRNGVFVRQMHLLPGEYQYKFIVDGVWHIDPAAEEHSPNTFGSVNSIIRV